MVRSTQQVVIIGAGPYGLAAAAHLRSSGVETYVFGEPMAFWRRQMPAGMFLRSAWSASHIADPDQTLTLDAFQVARGIQVPVPVPLDRFVEYGQWFQRQAVPDLDPRTVTQVQVEQRGFRVVLEDGESLQAARVIVASGLSSFAWRPPQFRGLLPSLASHASEHDDLTRFHDKQVIVVGGGQSALESAALLREAGAEVEVIARGSIRWLQRGAWLRDHLGPARPLLYPATDVGPVGLNWIVALPGLFKRFPRKWQYRIANRSIAPAGAAWLIPRLSGVPITTGRTVISTRTDGSRACLTLDNGDERRTDHVLLATGYQVNVRAHAFLSPTIARSLQCLNGYPALGTGFESSVHGLHFLGASAAESFGPLMRFVSGTGYATRQLTRRITSTSQTILVTVPAHQPARPTNGKTTRASGQPVIDEHPLTAGRDGDR